MVASLWLLVALTIPDAEARNRPRNQNGEILRVRRRRKDGQGETFFPIQGNFFFFSLMLN